MNKANENEIINNKKVFENLRVGKKDTGIKKRVNSSNLTVKKNYKLMKGISYGNDLNYQRYMAYLDKMREKEENDLNDSSKEINNNDYLDELDKNKLLSKKISFSEFSNKYKINPFLFQFFDYFDIQKIYRKDIERTLKIDKKKKPINLEKDFFDESEIIEDNNNNVQNTNLSVNKTENNYHGKVNKIYENFINKKYIKKKSRHIKSSKNFKKINLSGIDFHLINKLSAETLKVKKKIERLKYFNELNKEKERIYKKINRMLIDPFSYSKNKNINYNNVDDLIDKYAIHHRTEQKNVNKLKKLKMKIEKINEENSISKKKALTKKVYEYKPVYCLYIPNSSKYKHISYHKECLFNKEFGSNKNPKKKKNRISLSKTTKQLNNLNDNDIKIINKISYLIKTQKNNLFKNSNEYFITSSDNLKFKSNNIIANLKEIKNLLKKDKNYTSKTISRASNKYHENERIKMDQKLLERVMKDDKKNIKKIKNIQKQRKSKKINEKNNVFNNLKLINDCYDKERNIYSEMNTQFLRTLNNFCFKEVKENKKYEKILKNNYHLKIEHDNFDKNLENVKKTIDNRQHTVNSLNAKIQKKFYEINNMIDESCLKTKNSKF